MVPQNFAGRGCFALNTPAWRGLLRVMTQADQNIYKGAFLMLLAGLCFVAVTALVKLLDGRVPASEAAFLRYIMGVVLFLPMLRGVLRTQLTGRQWRLIGMRGIVHAVGVSLWFYAMTRIPLAEVTSLGYLTPAFVTVGAVFVLGERLAVRRVLAVVCALLGALVIVRPGFRALEPGHLAMLATSVFFAISYLTAKILADEVPATLIVATLSVSATIGLVPLAWPVWVTPDGYALLVLFGVACAATLGHFLMTLAFREAPITVTQPVTYLQLVWAVALGALVFAEPVDLWVIFGGSIILAAVSFITWREAVLKRRPLTPVSTATKL